ncbi:MAG: arylsulfatase [Candidatus Hydrogenedentota bacterium]
MRNDGTTKIGRRAFLQNLSAWGTAAALGALLPKRSSGGETKPSERPPDIVYIVADDMGWADIGYHGSEIQTPNLDALARSGVRFDHHYVAPTCTPTRVGLTTGKYPSRYGVVSPAYGDIFDDDTVTLAAALSNCGYHTAISGKWHMGSPPDCVPRKYGFDSSYGYFHGQIDPYTHLYKTGEACWHRNDELLEEKGHATDLITDEAVRVIEETDEAPLFLYVAYSVPHYPLDEPDPWVDLYANRFDSESRRWFAASITHMDAAIGRIIEALERTGKRERTLVVFTSDNGGQKSWHNAKQYHGRYADKAHEVLGDNRPLRGWKGDLYEGGIRVPALANWPRVLKPHIVSEPIHIVDWMPTLCALAGYVPEPRPTWDGLDVWPLIVGRKASLGARTMYWKTPKAYAVRQGAMKLILDDQFGKPELFNIEEDPYEKHDLAAERPEVVQKLRKLLQSIAADDRSR